MSIYTKPTCPKNTKLIKSRCECKKTNAKTPKKKTTNNKTKKKTTKKTKVDKYEEHWAVEQGQYSSRKPTKQQLKVRRRRIDEVYKIYEKIKKLDSSFLSPKKWRYPPEFCYNKQLQNVLKDIKEEHEYLEKNNI
jgi:hypothetical protein